MPPPRSDNYTFLKTTKTCRGRLKQILGLMLPVSASQLGEVVIDTANIYFAGHLSDPLYLAANGLALSAVNILALATMYGLAGALDTLAAQAYGSRNYTQAGRYLNQARLLILLATLFILLPLFYFSKYILIYLGIAPDLCELTCNYLRLVFPGIIFQTQSAIIKRFFRSQRVGWVHVLVVIVTIPTQWIGLFIAIRVLGFGFYAIPVCTSITYLVGFIIFNSYLYCCKIVHPRSLIPCSHGTSHKFCQFTKVALQSMAVTALGWWSFQITTILMALLGDDYLSAHTILTTLISMIWVFAGSGFSSTAASLVGNAIGMGEVKLAKQLARETSLYSTLFCLVIMTPLVLAPRIFLRVFTPHSQIIELATQVIPLAAAALVIGVGDFVIEGVQRGLGKLTPPMIVSVICNYCLYQPLSIYFAFHGWYLYGVWGFFALNSLVMLTIDLILTTLCYNWALIAERVTHKMQSSGLETPLLPPDS